MSAQGERDARRLATMPRRQDVQSTPAQRAYEENIKRFLVRPELHAIPWDELPQDERDHWERVVKAAIG